MRATFDVVIHNLARRLEQSRCAIIRSNNDIDFLIIGNHKTGHKKPVYTPSVWLHPQLQLYQEILSRSIGQTSRKVD